MHIRQNLQNDNVFILPPLFITANEAVGKVKMRQKSGDFERI